MTLTLVKARLATLVIMILMILGWKKWDTPVAFSAGLTHFLKVKEAQRVVYNKLFVNDGSGYSNTTGTFTCPQVCLLS